MNTSSLELIIFDLDGTLVHSVPDLTDALNIVLNLESDAKFNEVQVKKMVGSGIRKLIEEAAEKVGYTLSIDELVTVFKEQYNKNIVNKTTPYQGVKETLQQLPQFKKVVLSNKLDAFTKKVIHNVGLEEHFNLILGANTSLYGSKPSSEGIQYILDALKVNSENAIIIGDSTHDIHAGKKAGVATCAVTYGYRSREILEKESPDFIVNNLTEILELPLLNQR